MKHEEEAGCPSPDCQLDVNFHEYILELWAKALGFLDNSRVEQKEVDSVHRICMEEGKYIDERMNELGTVHEMNN